MARGRKAFERDGQSFSIDRTIRKSPTLSAKPPEGATVLFDGKSAKNFKPGKMTEDGLLMEGANSVAKLVEKARSAVQSDLRLLDTLGSIFATELVWSVVAQIG